MIAHDDPSLDAELDLLRAAPAPRAGLRREVLNAIALESRGAVRTANADEPRSAAQIANPNQPHGAAPVANAREPRRAATSTNPRGASLLDALAALWRDLGGARLAAPAFAMALAAGLGLSWLAEDAAAGDDSGDDLVALAQLDDAYEGLEP